MHYGNNHIDDVTIGYNTNGQLVLKDAAITKLQGRSLSSTAPIAGQFLGWDGSNWTPTNSLGSNAPLGLGTFATDPTLVMADKGKTWFNTTTGEVKYWNGSAAIALGAAGSGLANLNGEVGPTQSFGIPGTSGTAPAWSSASNAHTLNIPMSSAAGVTAGLLSKTDYDSFSAAVSKAAYLTVTAATDLNAIRSSVTTASSATGNLTLVTRDGTGGFNGSTIAAETKLSLKDGDGTTNWISLKAPTNVAADLTYTFPGTITSGSYLTTDASGNLSWSAPSSFAGSLVGDVTGTQGATVVANVGTSSAANIHTAEILANAATSAGTVSTIVKRDGAGNFTAGTITAALVGNASTATSATAAGSFTGSLVGDVTGTQGATAVATVGGSTAANVNAATVLANAATSAGTVSTIVKRDGSGNFTAGTITAALVGNASTATSATSAGSFTGSLVGDVTGTQGATVVANVGGSTAASVNTATGLANAATAANSNLAIVRRDTNGGFSNGQISITTPNATTQGLIVKGAAAQSSNLQEWQNSAGLVLAAIDSSGYLKLKDSDGTYNLTLRANPTMAANLTYTFPGAASAGSYLTTDASGNLSWSAPGSFTGSLVGDVTGTQGATVVANVGGSTAASVNTATGLANTATNANTASMIVKRDASGNFTAGTITAALVGNASTATSATSAGSFTGSLVGDVTGTQGATVVANVGGSTAANVNTATGLANTATNANTASMIVKRDASGNFTAGTITANLTGNVTGNVSGTAANVTGTVAVANGGTGATTAGGAKTALGFASSGANSDITSLSALSTALSVAQGGTGQTTAAGSLNALLPAQTGNSGKVLQTDATNASWVATTNWDTAFTDRNKWDGGATGLTAATGRTSLGLGSAAILDAGTAVNNLVQVVTGGKLPVLDGSNLTNLTGTDAARVAKAGDTMTGALNLPANGLVVGTSQLVLSGDNVGIGTTSPTAILHTNSSAAKTAAYTGILHSVADTSTTASINKVGMSIQSTGVWNGASAVNTGLIVGATGGTTNYAATFSGGNVGIGTSAPGAALDITGQIKIQGGTPGANKVLTSDAAGLASWAVPATSGTVTNIATGTGLSGGPITSTGTISLADTAVTPGAYTRATITVDQQGRLTAAAAGAAPILSSADVSGTLSVANGGTGGTTYNANTVILGGGGTLPFTSASGSADQVLRMSAGGAPVFGAIDLTKAAAVSGALPVANGGTGVTTSTGTGSVVLSNSPALVTPALGTPASGVATNLTGLPLTSGVTGTLPVANGGTGVTTKTGTGGVVLSDSPTLVTPILGTPASGVATNLTGLPLTSGVTGTLPVANGGTGATTLTANNVLLGNGTSALQVVAPTTSGNVLTANGTTWQSTALPATTWATPGTIGSGTPNTGAFTTLTTSGNVGIGTTAPAQRLDLGGGNIAMGYEIVTSSNCTSSAGGWATCTATCPAGKQVLGGACGTQCCTRLAEYTTASATSYTCGIYQTNGAQAFNATAICANIK